MTQPRTLRKYIGRGFLTTFLIAFVVVTFVSSLWFLFKLTDVLARGVGLRPVVRIFLYSMPTSTVLAMPLAALISSLLVFGRLSADGEIMAMRASGVSMAQILSGPLLWAALLSVFSLYIAHELEPRAHFLRRSLDATLKGVSPLDVLREGRLVRDIEGVTLFVGRKRGNVCEDIRIYDAREEGLIREIRAERALARVDANSIDLVLNLENVRIEPTSREIRNPSTMGRYTFRLKQLGRTSQYTKDHEDMPLAELVIAYVRSATDFEKYVLRYELSRRTAMAFSSFALVLVGIPLGIKSHRKESTQGIALALGMFVVFYACMLLAQSLLRLPGVHAEVLTWAPVVLASGLGVFLARRTMP